jgi:type II secretory pathway component PulF
MRYIFTAKTLDEKIINGIVKATTENEAVKMLQNKELEVISIVQEKKRVYI